MTEIKLRPCPFCGSEDAPRMMTRNGKDGWRDRFINERPYSETYNEFAKETAND